MRPTILFLFTELRRRGAVAMKNFLGALLLALKNFLKAVIVRAAEASGLVKVLWGCFIKISWQYRGYVPKENTTRRVSMCPP